MPYNILNRRIPEQIMPARNRFGNIFFQILKYPLYDVIEIKHYDPTQFSFFSQWYALLGYRGRTIESSDH